MLATHMHKTSNSMESIKAYMPNVCFGKTLRFCDLISVLKFGNGNQCFCDII